MFPFSRRRDDPHREAASRLKDRLRAHLRLGPEDGLTVSEIVCPDPACPGTETVVLVMRPGQRTAALKIAKPLAAVTDDDLAALSLPPDA
jgi:hypothetical protein